MPEYLAPGVYIQEMPSANKAIQGASTSTAGMVGLTERGPVGVPTLVTSAGAFKRIFGGLLNHKDYAGGKDALPHAANGFFANGGSRLYVVRVIDAAATIAKVMLPDASAAATLQICARSAGKWGDSLRVKVTHTNRVETEVAANAAKDAVEVALLSTFGLAEGSILDIGGQIKTIKTIKPGNVVELMTGLDPKVDKDVTVKSVEFDLLIEKMSGLIAVDSEIFTGLNMSMTSTSFAPLVLGKCDVDGANPTSDGQSNLIRVHVPATPGLRPKDSLTPLAGGGDGTISDNTFIGVKSDDPRKRTGIQALANEPGISLVAVPGNASVTVQKELLTHCEQMVYRFAVLDMPKGASIADSREHRGQFDSTRAAIYYPWLTIADPFGGKGDIHTIPPSGHMIGIYARTDNSRGVWKTPANEVVRNVLGFDIPVNKGEQDILNPININCLRDFRSDQRGLRVWGGRTATSDPEWKYLAVRRTFLFIEQSLDAGLQWSVFEPNAKPLWDTVRQSITGFLDSIWRQGGLAGATRDEAFFVNVGYGETMEQDDLANGRLIVQVGIAPVYPAEFVIIQISQKTLEAAG